MAEEVEPRVFSTNSLYQLTVASVADRFFIIKKCLDDIPSKIVFDIYYQLYKEKRLCLLGGEMSNLQTFSRLLSVRNRKLHLLQIFQALMDHGTKVSHELALSYGMHCLATRKNQVAFSNAVALGLRLGAFLSDAGWYSDSETVLLACQDLCLSGTDSPSNWCKTLDCCHKLLHAQAVYCAFEGAAETHRLAVSTVEKLKTGGYDNLNHAALYAEFSLLFFTRSEYDESYRWSIAALKELKPGLPARIMIDVLRQAARSCVVKREFQKAGLLIRQALYLAREVFDVDHPRYCDVLSDYGFYLLNYDSVANSVSVYQSALTIRKSIFGKSNLYVAITHEDLAYALYVHEYSSGRFHASSENVDLAIQIMERLLPGEHLLLASAKRVKALILEEIALDNHIAPMSEQDLLLKSEGLHLSALLLARSAFGERNVQTAKHYGNLGRLYQSMRRFQEAEAMHLKAISIKEELLGPNDYEVALSVGHLASLYNYHMSRYRDAEKLYHRSININITLFGNGYSGLEYDYLGLLHVYRKLDEPDKILEYRDSLAAWRDFRYQNAQLEDPPIDITKRPQPIQCVIQEFFEM